MSISRGIVHNAVYCTSRNYIDMTQMQVSVYLRPSDRKYVHHVSLYNLVT